MTTAANDTSHPKAMSAGEKISILEQRYIELLESKISKLELEFGTLPQTTAPSNPKSSDAKVDDNEVYFKRKHENMERIDSSLDQDGAEGEEEPESRYRIVISKWDSESGEHRLVDAGKKEEKKSVLKSESGRAFTFRKDKYIQLRTRIHQPHEIMSAEVQIEFQPLQKLLWNITSKWGVGETATRYSSPFSVLIYSWSEAMKEAEKEVTDELEDEKQARKDLKELLNVISTSSGHLRLDQYFKDRKTFLEEETITHNALWTLFPPGTFIFARPFLGQPQIFSVQSNNGFVEENDPFRLVCYSFDWNGHEFNRVPYELEIEYWGTDQKSIVELPFYPLDYHVDAGVASDHTYDDTQGDENQRRDVRMRSIETLTEKLIKRGKKYVEICTREKGKQMFKYMGAAHTQNSRGAFHRTLSSHEKLSRGLEESLSVGSSEPSTTYDMQYVSKSQIYGTTMVDFVSFFEYMSPTMPILGQLRRHEGPLESLSPERRRNPVFQKMYKFDWDNHKRDKKFSNDQYLLCPPRVLGYALKEKQWVQLLVDRLDDPEKADTDTFEEKLQLDEDYKDLVRKSVLAHEQGKTQDKAGRFRALEDFAPNKGRGLIIMLYGYPGVGKTLTAESVALVAHKPLLSIGVSDIGIEGDKVEVNLQKVFDLAGRWEAVLLFDEADVFLEARGEGENDLKRNALVSVLLRVLEYYEGILILTTNRMRSFDIAVQSRIHIAIKYEELTQDQKINIFMSFLDQLHKKKLVDDYRDIESWVKKDGKKLPFNGREIRNVVSTALGIALMEVGKVERKHLSTVAEQTSSFKNELKSQEAIFKYQHK